MPRREFVDIGHRAPLRRARRGLELAITDGCLRAITRCVMPERRRHHEGVAYLLGRTDGRKTCALDAMRPTSVTTIGSFAVSPVAMAKVVRAATDRGLQLIGQAHTHPGAAFHSIGDEEGARNAYSGYVSLVFPCYGKFLPELTGTAIFFFDSSSGGFVALRPDAVAVVTAEGT